MQKKIRIIRTPKGRMTPYEMRDAWLKVESMPLSEVQNDPEHVFNVVSTVAISALRVKDPIAATWWETHCDVSDDVLFAFPRTICELVEDEIKEPAVEADEIEAVAPKRSTAAMTASNWGS